MRELLDKVIKIIKNKYVKKRLKLRSLPLQNSDLLANHLKLYFEEPGNLIFTKLEHEKKQLKDQCSICNADLSLNLPAFLEFFTDPQKFFCQLCLEWHCK